MFGLFNKVKSWFSTPDENDNGLVIDDIAKVAIKDVKKAVVKVKKTKKQLEALTKNQLEEFGREINVELDRRLTKAKLVAQLVSAQRKKKGE
tara:strand:- start:1029 stop:1304 length:276 start_codon:yes stop_codon:yes gene_type:complete